MGGRHRGTLGILKHLGCNRIGAASDRTNGSSPAYDSMEFFQAFSFFGQKRLNSTQPVLILIHEMQIARDIFPAMGDRVSPDWRIVQIDATFVEVEPILMINRR